ncbi:lipocalin family protein [Methylophaga lonarensis]|uniref:lipocalin family protein n=1 Tax=Methylophaga lonarensis TaxID=999151 RepID=UPI003D26B406
MKLKLIAIYGFLLIVSACTRVPSGVSPITDFELQSYLGKWYEIARLDHSFERGLSQVYAEYSLREDGGVRVINRGFDAARQQWKEAEGRAYFVKDSNTGHLKVSFFGPFYGSYVIFELDSDYQYTFVAGPSHKYLWLLARTPQVDDEVMSRFIEQAAQAGFAVDELIVVEHD